MTFRKLGRSSTHRKSLLRNLVSSLIEHESITTTHAKAKEAQVAAERLISLAKNKSPDPHSAQIRAQQYIFKTGQILPKLFGELSERYKDRTGGYTRVLRLENRIGDNAPQSILELVGGKKDMRRAITARAVARIEKQGLPLDSMTKQAVESICRHSTKTREDFRNEVEFMKEQFYASEDSVTLQPPSREIKRRAPLKFVKNPLDTKA
ncbi:mitochondrial 54S ribosomal protein YmL8 [Sugiyamaella lignohabitans]|uniref:Mitochondrial 54S ribosomal protein YmL8 n=1 Tax=Sugiyamaella lignohabitans TaxID=796027 RepID=A0A167FIN5_9ASCO|nr:mitochondrial 54S ribosomal protein YmL8 [Sugiyamaella lignohabitans]ANB15351.1 mitochondrial 54S ribosomal protein YmL8 [Sugiyamaella lignohabitans]